MPPNAMMYPRVVITPTATAAFVPMAQVDGVVPLDHRELGEVSVDRLGQVPHGGLEFGELGIRLE